MPGRSVLSAVTVEEYLADERAALEHRSELWEGEVIAKSGASWVHNIIKTNLMTELNVAVRGQGCHALSSDLKIHVPRKGGFVYPDVVVVCESPQFLDDHRDVVQNPVLIAEVLSPSTERFDRGDKSDGYRSIPSVQQIVLLSQTRRQVEHYARLEDNSWRLRVYQEGGEGGMDVDLSPLVDSVSLDAIYRGVSFE